MCCLQYLISTLTRLDTTLAKTKQATHDRQVREKRWKELYNGDIQSKFALYLYDYILTLLKQDQRRWP